MAKVKNIFPIETGWVADTGTAEKTSSATYTAPTAGILYSQSDTQDMMDKIQANSRAIKAIKDLLISIGIAES